MQSITTSREKIWSFLNSASYRADDERQHGRVETPSRSEVEHGLDVLLDLVGHVRLPINKQEEFTALKALRHLYLDLPLSEELLNKKDEICRHVELVKQDEAIALLEWVDPKLSGFAGVKSRLSRTHERHLLLFVLLAKVVAPVTKFDIVPILYDQGYLENVRERFGLVSWVPRVCAGPTTVRLAMEYIELSRMVLFSDDDQRPSDAEVVNAVRQWGWRRQVAQLVVWRHVWDLERERYSRKPGNPVFHADTIEYALANEGFFDKLNRRGGPVAAAALKRMGYRDRADSFTRLRARGILTLVVIIAACVLASMFFSGQIRRWDRENRALAESIEAYENRGLPWVSTVGGEAETQRAAGSQATMGHSTRASQEN